MGEWEIPEAVVDAAAKALWDRPRSRGGKLNSDTNPQWATEKGQAEVAIRAALDAWGATVEKRSALTEAEVAGEPYSRIVLPWLPVGDTEQEVDQ